MTRSCRTVLSATHISMPNSSSLSMSMSEQRTSRRKSGTPTTFRKIGLPIKLVRLLLSFLFELPNSVSSRWSLLWMFRMLHPFMISVLSGKFLTYPAGEKFGCSTRRISPFAFNLRMDPKLPTRKLDQSNRNQHSLRTSVHGLSLHPQRHQLHNKFRGHVYTRITLTSSTTHGLSQRHHLARAALGHNTGQVVSKISSRGGGRGVDFMGWEDRL